MPQNPILEAARDGWDSHDGRCCAMNGAFACADALQLAGEFVPADWEYSPGLLGGPGMTEAAYMGAEYGDIGAVVWAELVAGRDDTVRFAGRAFLMLAAYADSVAGDL